MKLYGHPWSINTRKSLATFAEKGHEPTVVLVMLPKGEQRSAEHLRLHPFGKVPVLDDAGFVVYESRAINAYLDATLAGPRLVPTSPRERARMDQWINVCDAYFTPFAQPLIVETLFRQFLGGPVDRAAIEAGRSGIGPALDQLDGHLADNAYVAGDAFTLADIHWMPYVEYLSRIGEGAEIDKRSALRRWWGRVSERPGWQRTARSGPQPYHPEVAAEVIARLRGE